MSICVRTCVRSCACEGCAYAFRFVFACVRNGLVL